MGQVVVNRSLGRGEKHAWISTIANWLHYTKLAFLPYVVGFYQQLADVDGEFVHYYQRFFGGSMFV